MLPGSTRAASVCSHGVGLGLLKTWFTVWAIPGGWLQKREERVDIIFLYVQDYSTDCSLICCVASEDIKQHESEQV